MVVESVIVDIVDKVRVEGYLFRRFYVVEVRRILKISQAVAVLERRHRGGWDRAWRKSVAVGGQVSASAPGTQRSALVVAVQYN